MSLSPRMFLLASIFVLGVLVTIVSAGVCPQVGQDTDCGLIITITDSGTTLSPPTGQPPFDGIEDTLIGVVNNSSLPIHSLTIKSSKPVFDFDGDGLITYGLSNGFDKSGYGGDNAYFSSPSSDFTSGTVNFVFPIAPGKTSYFALEDDIASATGCPDILNNPTAPVTPKIHNSTVIAPSITAEFRPKNSTLAEAAKICGFKDFNWQQTILLWPRPSTLKAGVVTMSAPPSFLDPPVIPYDYVPDHHGYPFYYDMGAPSNQWFSLSYHKRDSDHMLHFEDVPEDSCLPGNALQAFLDGCGGQAPDGSYLAFETKLVGVDDFNQAIDLGISFNWKDTYNGSSGGISKTLSDIPTTPRNGTGTITVTSVHSVPTYGNVIVTAINGERPDTIKSLTAGSACNGTFSGTFHGNITISVGQICKFINGKINGNVENHRGTLILIKSLVTGNVASHNANSFIIGPYSAINGNLEIERGAASNVSSQICDSFMYGNVSLESITANVQIGSTNAAVCGGNVIAKNFSVENNAGNLMLFNNTVTGNMSCEHNSSISGSGNVARKKQNTCKAL